MAHPRGKNSQNRSRMPTSFTLSDEAKDYLGQLANTLGLSMTAVVEILVREKWAEYKREGRIKLF